MQYTVPNGENAAVRLQEFIVDDNTLASDDILALP